MPADFAPALDDGQADYATRAEADALNAAINATVPVTGCTCDYCQRIADAVRTGWEARAEL